MLAPEAWVPVADVLRPHGVRGELRLRPYNRQSDLLLDVERVLLRFSGESTDHERGNGEARARTAELRVEGVRDAHDAILMKLEGIDDRDRAAELRGAVVCARRGDFPPLEPGEFYACDIEGADVVVAGGDRLGTVVEMRTYPTVEVLVVRAADGGKPWEVPLLDDIVEQVDDEHGRVVLRTLEGVERG